MRVVIVGASGRMGLAITRAALEMGDVMFVGAIDREGAAAVGRDLGELAGLRTGQCCAAGEGKASLVR